MILSDVDICRRIDDGELVIEPLDDPAVQIQPASIDVRLGHEFLRFNHTHIAGIHPDSTDEIEEYVDEIHIGPGEEFVLHPGDFVLGTTIERVEIPADLMVHLEGRSSLGRLAIVIHSTAGVCDPGFRGQITLELSNLGKAPVALSPGMRIGQLIVIQLTSPAERLYGDERRSKYQDQSGPRVSQLQDDHHFQDSCDRIWRFSS